MSAEAFGLSRRLAASQARHAHEAQSNDPCAELDGYLNDPLESHGIDMLNFWKVSLTLNVFRHCVIFVNGWLYRIEAPCILCSG